MLCFARLIRCAIVASGTRNAFAISAVVSPPTARSVSAIADARRQRRMAAHEEQDRACRPSLAPSSRRVRRRREVGVRRLLAVRDSALAPAPRDLAAQLIGHAPRGDVDQPAARIVGHAFARPLHRRRDQRLLHRVLGRGEVAEAPDDGAEHLRRELAQQVLVRRRRGCAVTRRRAARSSPGAPRSACQAVPRRARARPTRARRSRTRAAASRRRRSSSPRGLPSTPGTARQ